MSYTNRQPAQGRPGPAYSQTNILVNTSFPSNLSRHGSPGAQNVLPSIGERAGYPPLGPPPYEEDGKGGSQPSSTGAHGFPSLNPTAGAGAGSRHDRR
jgi:hypothetical protein